jgi:2-oxoglutarate ferredoxin oxidoreductase subunit beta
MSQNEFCTRETAWCPGCGNFSILSSLKKALEKLELEPHQVLMVAGIGQAAKTPQYIFANAYCGLHGRALPPAVAAKIANEALTVILDTGDGDSYGEGGNHFIHNIRRNVDVSHFVHDNQIYGLTKGQASPTTELGHVTGVQADGNINMPFNPMLMALAAGAGFVARGFTGDPEQLVALMEKAIRFKGYALIDILQPCVSFNKINTFDWYKQRVKPISEVYDPTDFGAAISLAQKFGDEIPTGVLYEVEKPVYHERHPVLRDRKPLISKKTDQKKLEQIIRSFI